MCSGELPVHSKCYYAAYLRDAHIDFFLRFLYVSHVHYWVQSLLYIPAYAMLLLLSHLVLTIPLIVFDQDWISYY